MINSLKIYTVYFDSLPSWGLLKHTETKLQTIFFLPHIKLFWKIKRGQGLVFLPHFPDNFWRKIFLLSYYINWPSFIVWLALLREVMGNILIAIVCSPGCDVMNVAVNLIFLIKPLFLHDQKLNHKQKL